MAMRPGSVAWWAEDFSVGNVSALGPMLLLYI